jgi:hypothetical protein
MAMTTKFQTTLPPEWEPGYDQVIERWFFVHRPSGFSQYILPKAGDEVSRAAELVPRVPSIVTSNTEGLFIVPDERDKITDATVQSRLTQSPPSTPSDLMQTQFSIQQPVQAASTSQRRNSGAIARKPLRKPVAAPNVVSPVQVIPNPTPMSASP